MREHIELRTFRRILRDACERRRWLSLLASLASNDGIQHVVFETNHPELDVSDGDVETDEITVIHKIARFTRQYANRWGIENGYKKTKTFMAETTSKDHSYLFQFHLRVLAVLTVATRRYAGETLARRRVSGAPRARIDVPHNRKKEYGLNPPE